jgi:hypothetical protein
MGKVVTRHPSDHRSLFLGPERQAAGINPIHLSGPDFRVHSGSSKPFQGPEPPHVDQLKAENLQQSPSNPNRERTRTPSNQFSVPEYVMILVLRPRRPEPGRFQGLEPTAGLPLAAWIERLSDNSPCPEGACRRLDTS